MALATTSAETKKLQDRTVVIHILTRSISAVLFDLDGTLIETHIDFPTMTQAMCQMAEEAGVGSHFVEGRDILGIVEAVQNELNRRGEDGEVFRRDAFAVLEHIEVEGCSQPVLLHGTVECLTELRQRGVAVGIVTRNCSRVATSLLAQFNVPYAALLTRDDVRRAKPHPEHLHEALTQLNVVPEQAMMVGDHWMDIQAGKAAGCAVTIGVLGRHSADRFSPCPPDYLVRDLSEVLTNFLYPLIP